MRASLDYREAGKKRPYLTLEEGTYDRRNVIEIDLTPEQARAIEVNKGAINR